MIARINTVAFLGVDVLEVDLQVQISKGLPAFSIVGLPDKAIAESKERVRASLNAIGLSLPPKRITINLSPADLMKEGSHFDLPIAVGLLVAMDILPKEDIANYVILGELALDGGISPVSGVLPASLSANANSKGLICPFEQGSEAVWAGDNEILAPKSLVALINHFKGNQILSKPEPKKQTVNKNLPDLIDIKGQESAKRALEVAAAGGHNILMVGPPGSGKSMLAERLPSLLPPLSPKEALDASMIHSIAGKLKGGKIINQRPFRAPHHNASTPALVGGGNKSKPGEISLAHNGVLFLDELPEFSRQTLEALRQPLESGKVTVARVNSHVTYPADFQLVAAMNPCKCGYLGVKGMECSRAPKCGAEYQSKISGPLLDRIDIHIEVPAVNPWELANYSNGESSQTVANRVLGAREIQHQRFLQANLKGFNITTNSQMNNKMIEDFVNLEKQAKELLINACEKLHVSARGYHRLLKLSRTLADLEQEEIISKIFVAEALSYRKIDYEKHTINS